MSFEGSMLLCALGIGFLFTSYYSRKAKRKIEKFEREKRENEAQKKEA